MITMKLELLLHALLATLLAVVAAPAEPQAEAFSLVGYAKENPLGETTGGAGGQQRLSPLRLP